MKHFLLLTVAFSTTSCVAILLLFNPSLQAEDIQQPATLLAAAKSPVEHDSQVKPAGCCDGGSSCCSCEPVCCPRCVVGEVEKKCWNVKCKPVCIPKFRWPWECRAKPKGSCAVDCGFAVDTCCGDECCGECCSTPPKCGKVKTVTVLEEHKYTCKECGYEWDIKCVCRKPKHK
jgi:hypothetical protein